MKRIKAISAIKTAALETFLYACLSMLLAMFRFILIDKEFNQYFSQKNINVFLIVFSVVLASVFIARFLGGTSFKEVIKKQSNKNYEISTTMAAGGISGFITYLFLELIT